MVERRLSVGVFARFDEQVCDLACVMIVAAVELGGWHVFVVAVSIGRKSLVPIFHETLARDTAHALLPLLALVILAKIFFVLSVSGSGLLAIPVRPVDVVVGAVVAFGD